MNNSVHSAISDAIKALRLDRDAIDKQISALEKITGNSSGPTRKRGRKKMSTAERRKVAQRMKSYWANRRAKKKPVAPKKKEKVQAAGS